VRSVYHVVEDIRVFIGGMAEDPGHLVDNEFIHRGYRIGYNKSIKSILRSLFQFHNESVNVWSHLIGMLFFGTVMILYTLN
jgi:adiponectin receptor